MACHVYFKQKTEINLLPVMAAGYRTPGSEECRATERDPFSVPSMEQTQPLAAASPQE